MKLFFTVALLIISVFCFSQNVGINNPAPAEKLDVNGNINVAGTIKANGVDGLPNQVLMKNSGGSLAWGDMCEFKNFVSLYLPTGSWIVPAGVSKVLVELWGGGGGGNAYAGGGGGGYICAYFPVTEGTSLPYVVGNGGSGATSAAGSGDNSYLTAIPGSLTFFAHGGGGANYSGVTNWRPGAAGNFDVSTATGFNNFMGSNGQPGSGIKKTFLQYGPTTFYELAEGGDGGSSPYAYATGGSAGSYIYNITTPSLVLKNIGNPYGISPGGGGACGMAPGGVLTSGSPGGAGLIIIRY